MSCRIGSQSAARKYELWNWTCPAPGVRFPVPPSLLVLSRTDVVASLAAARCTVATAPPIYQRFQLELWDRHV
jgi:hypothetical protein